LRGSLKQYRRGKVPCRTNPTVRFAASTALLINSLAYVRPDKFPVAPGHLLTIPLRHDPDFLAIRVEELAAVWALVGEAAGQTVAHAHLHLIPRYRGDSENPRGGVRGVIPAKRHYES
jgi:diadenosine tetraphosphate (Ap4A) HIT family hydrolase